VSKRVLDVGNCSPDHASIRRFLTNNYDVEVVQTHGLLDTLSELRANKYDLVLVNRKLDADYSDGIEILRAIKADREVADVPVMIITNYPEHQEAAIAAGAHQGFGKLEFDRAETKDRLAAVLT
jgi:CheY-like chemotaxis protein